MNRLPELLQIVPSVNILYSSVLFPAPFASLLSSYRKPSIERLKKNRGEGVLGLHSLLKAFAQLIVWYPRKSECVRVPVAQLARELRVRCCGFI